MALGNVAIGLITNAKTLPETTTLRLVPMRCSTTLVADNVADWNKFTSKQHKWRRIILQSAGLRCQEFSATPTTPQCGYQAAAVTTASDVTAIGSNALVLSTGGTGNVAVGSAAMSAVVTGPYNTGIGTSSLASLTSGSSNTALGTNAGSNVTTGSSNIAIGRDALISGVGVTNELSIGSAAYYVATNGGATTYFATATAGAVALPAASLGFIRINLNGTLRQDPRLRKLICPSPTLGLPPASSATPSYEGQTDVVTSAFYTVLADDGEGHTADPTPISSRPRLDPAVPFIPYADLTPEIVIGWVQSNLGPDRRRQRFEASLDRPDRAAGRPRRPSRHVLPLPWAPPSIPRLPISPLRKPSIHP
jgi:hypothetical protein